MISPMREILFRFSFFAVKIKFAVDKTLLSLVIIFSLSPLRLHSSERRQRALKE
jgi:hypothetical protein